MPDRRDAPLLCGAARERPDQQDHQYPVAGKPAKEQARQGACKRQQGQHQQIGAQDHRRKTGTARQDPQILENDRRAAQQFGAIGQNREGKKQGDCAQNSFGKTRRQPGITGHPAPAQPQPEQPHYRRKDSRRRSAPQALLGQVRGFECHDAVRLIRELPAQPALPAGPAREAGCTGRPVLLPVASFRSRQPRRKGSCGLRPLAAPLRQSRHRPGCPCNPAVRPFSVRHGPQGGSAQSGTGGHPTRIRSGQRELRRRRHAKREFFTRRPHVTN